MKSSIQLICASVVILTSGCLTEPGRPAIDPQAATPSFETPEGLTRLLEERWSLAEIRAFCIPERRYNFWYQNLVTDTPEVWEGELYPEAETGFDRISWYATVRDDRAINYSLGVNRGEDYWLLEIGSQELVRNPPEVTPDPSNDLYFGNRSRADLLRLQNP